MQHICIATEDELSESILEKILQTCASEIIVTQKLRKNGFGYLKKNLPKFNELSKNVIPVLLLTDLDQKPCVVEFIQDWTKELHLSNNLLFRVAIREVETWLLADKTSLSQWLGVSQALITSTPEELVDPKQTLLNIIKRSNQREIKEDILPSRTSNSPVGLGYNTRMIQYVNTYWNPQEAAQASPSLSRTIQRIATLEAR